MARTDCTDTSIGTEIVFVDSRVPDLEAVLGAIDPNTEIIFIDPARDGVKQMAEALAGRQDVGAIHVVSHGDSGMLLLGDGPLHSGNIAGYAEALAQIGRALADDGDIHLWGCDVGAGIVGRSFLDALAEATGADIAASTDDTGGGHAGADWELEIATGAIMASNAMNTAALASFDDSLATFSVSTLAELRNALNNASINDEADTITFTGNIEAAGLGEMLASLTDDHRTMVDIDILDGQTLKIVGGGYALDANYYGRVLEVRSGTVEISDLTIREGLVSGDGGDKNMAGGDAFGGAIRNQGDLTLTGVTIADSGAAGGGGGGGAGIYAGGGGGGGGGLSGIGGGDGGIGGTAAVNYAGSAGGAGMGGNGGDYSSPINNQHGGRGGSTDGGDGGANPGYASGGSGGTASNGTLSIGGGGGGAAYADNGGIGGDAAGAIYNSGDLTILSSTISNNVGAGGGGGAGGVGGMAGIGADGGLGVGGIWNAESGILRLDLAGNSNLMANAGAGGIGGAGSSGNGTAGAGYTDIYNLGTLDTNHVPNPAPIVDANGPVGGTANTTTFIEDGGSVLVVANDATLTDDDDITGMILVLSAAPDGTSETIFYSAALNGGASLASLGLTGSYDSVTETYTLSGTASAAVYQGLLRAMIYNNSSQAPDTTARTVTISATDAEGAVGQATATTNITAVNDAPTAINLTQTKGATEAGSTVALDDIVVTDVDTGDTITATLTLSDTAAGTLSTGTYGTATSTFNSGTGVWTVTGSVTDVNAALAAVALTPSSDNDQNFTITTRIRDAAGTSPADGTISVTVTVTADAPTATNLTQTKAATEAGSAVALDDVVVTDVDTGDTITATLTLSDPAAGSLSTGTYGSATSTYNAGTGVWTVTGSAADVNAALAAVALTPSADNDQSFTITTRIRDAAGTGPADGNISVSVTGINDAPTATNLTQSKSATEAGSAVAFDDIVVSAIDIGETITATLTLSDPLAGSLSTGTYGSATSIYNAGTGVWTMTGSVADVNAALAAVALTPSADNDQDFTITTRIRDAADTGPADGNISVSVTGVSDAPAGADKTVTVSEDGSFTFTPADFGFSDSDGDALAGVRIATLPGAGTLTLDGVAVSAGTVIAKADLNAAKLMFTPAAGANGAGYASFTFQVQDDSGTDSGVDLDQSANTITVDVTSVNDAPSGTDKTVTTNEDTSHTFTAADFGFSDSDGGALAGVKITTLPGVGTLTIDGAAVSANTAISKADIDAGKLVFTPTADANGTGYASFTFQVQDDGGTANAGVDLDQSVNTITLDVTSINDAPSGADKTITPYEDGAYTFAATDFGFSDSDGDVLAGVKIATLPGAGTLTLDGVAASAGIVVTTADLNAGKLVFTPSANTNGAGYASFTFQVQDDGGIGIDLDQSANTITVDVASVNDAPFGVDNTVTVSEDGSHTFATTDFGFSDSDGNSLTGVKVTTLPIAGTLALDGAAVFAGDMISRADLDAGKLVFTPATNANGTGYASFTFQVQDDGDTANAGVDLDQSANTITLNVTSANDGPTGSVEITGSVAEDQTLTASNTLADDDGLGTISYQWQAGGVEITGATGSSFTLTQDEVGKTITVIASYTDDAGTAESVTSAATAAVVNADDAPTGTVTIGGTAAEDQTLTASNTLDDADGLGTISYQWNADGNDIVGATGSTFTLTQDEVGKTVTVTASYTDDAGTAESVTSAATAAVVNVDDAPTGSVTISGTAKQGGTLTANTSSLADEDGLGTLTYQWLADSVAIDGATDATLSPGQTQVGKTISVTVSYTDQQGTSERVTSAATAAVENVNDAPTIGGLSDANVTTGRPSDLPDITVSDLDGDTLTVTLTSADGTIGGMTDEDDVTVGIQVSGGASDINTVLAAAIFTATADGAATVEFSVMDDPGGAVPVTGTLNLTASPPPPTDPDPEPPVDDPIIPGGAIIVEVEPSTDGSPVTGTGDPDTVDEVQIAGSVILGENLENAYLLGTGDYTVEGNDLDNTVYGNVGNTTIIASGGNDTIDGGWGFNSVVFSGPASDYSIEIIDGIAEVTDLLTGDVSRLANIQEVAFSDGTQPLFATSQIVLSGLYETFLGRDLDGDGFDFWMELSAGGAGPRAIAEGFLNSPEFVERTEDLTPEAFVSSLFNDFLDRDIDQAGYDFWVDAIEQGLGYGDVALEFVLAQEVGTRLDDLMNRGDWLAIG